jgi:hypothetical protein
MIVLNKLPRFCAALPVAMAVTAGFAFSSVNVTLTATVIEIGGIGWETLDQDIMESTFGGVLNDGVNTFVNIPWPGQLGAIGESVDLASNALYAELLTTPGPKIAVGLSGSTMAINDVMRRLAVAYANDPTSVPSPDEVTFMVAGDAERGIFPALVPFFGQTIPGYNYTVKPIPVTPYDITVVKGEYDAAGDWPDRPWNLLAVANGFAASGAFEGFGSVHFDAIFADYTTVPAKNITTTVNSAGGTTTTYLIPTADLPILRPLIAQGVPQSTVDALTSVLKPIVDRAYRRNDWRPAGGPPQGIEGRQARGAEVRNAINETPVANATVAKATPVKATVAKASAARAAARGANAR